MTKPLPKVPVETIIEKIDKPKSSGVAIKIMVSLLILVILSEVGYLVYNNYFKPSTESLSGPTIENHGDEIDRPIKDVIDTSLTLETEKGNYASIEKIKKAISRFEIIDAKYNEIALTYKVEGKISEKTIITSDYFSNVPTRIITIKSEHGESAFALELGFDHQIIFSSDNDDNSQKISYDDIKVGDTVTIKRTISSSNSGERKTTIITKITNQI